MENKNTESGRLQETAITMINYELVRVGNTSNINPR